MANYRNVRTNFTPEQRRQYKRKAEQVEGEKDAIIAQARRAEARAGMLRRVLHELKDERERLGMSLADVSEKAGIDKAALSRLENAANANPKLDTLVRYAQALGVELSLTVQKKG